MRAVLAAALGVAVLLGGGAAAAQSVPRTGDHSGNQHGGQARRGQDLTSMGGATARQGQAAPRPAQHAGGRADANAAEARRRAEERRRAAGTGAAAEAYHRGNLSHARDRQRAAQQDSLRRAHPELR